MLALVLCGIANGQTPRGATFGTVIPIGGHVADIALDEPRGRLYAANFTANRIEVISTADGSRLTPIVVPAQPGSLALSPDGRYLVIGHYASPLLLQPAVTVLNLETGTQQTFARDSSPLAIAFGNGSQALIASNDGFELLDPATGTFRTLVVAPADSKGLPVPFATFPPEILQASSGVSGDGQTIYVLVQASAASAVVQYRVTNQDLVLTGITSTPDLGPAAVSVDQDGSTFLAGWVLINSHFVFLAQFPYATGRLNTGSHAFDSSRNLIYAYMPTATEISPSSSTLPAPDGDGAVLTILDSDNLTVRERIRIPESLAGKSLLSSDFRVMYSASDSGVTIFPIGSLAQTHRVTPLQEDVVFPSNACDRSVITREVDLVDPGGGNTDFSLSTSAPGVRIFPQTGTTPARVTIEVDPTVYQSQTGTTAVFMNIGSSAAINIPLPVRLLINTREPDQRGMFVNVPGKLVDILADPLRDRFYVLRQDKNLVLIFDGTTFAQLATLRTGNTPTQMAITNDRKYLIVGNDNSQIANVYDLDTLQPSQFIEFPPGHYPRSIAVSNGSILAASRVAGSAHQISRIDFDQRIAHALPTLGIYENDISEDTVLTASPSGEYIFIAMPNGTLVLYEAAADTFVASRMDFGALSGAAAAWTDRIFVADDKVVNWSLVPITQLETQTGSTTGLIFFDGFGLRTTSQGEASPGFIQRVDLTTFNSIRPTRMAESPLLSASLQTPPIGQIGQTILPFLRTLAPLANRTSIISLTTSGFTVLPWDFEVVLPTPSVSQIVNLADGTSGVAPGGLVSIFGSNFTTTGAAAAAVPLPFTLGDVCVAVNNVALPLLLTSSGRIAAQLPFNLVGQANLVVRGSGGVSNPFPLTILTGAPAVFRTASAGPMTGLPMLYRATNNEVVTLTNPIHPRDIVRIYLTGLGETSPAVQTGAAAPSDPLANALQEPTVSLADKPLAVSFAGLVPGMVGVYQINAVVPDTVPEGLSLPLIIEQGSYATTLQVRVVR